MTSRHLLFSHHLAFLLMIFFCSIEIDLQAGYLQTETTPTLKYLKSIDIKETNSGLDLIDCVYVINLDARPEKWERMQGLLKEKGIHANRIAAVNGWELTDDIAKELAGPYSVQLKGGALGCLLSHISIYKDAYDRGFKTIWIMEDDVDFLGDVREITSYLSVLSRVDPGWDVFYTDVDCRNDQGSYFMSVNEKGRPDQQISPPWYYCLRVLACNGIMRVFGRYGTTSMLISSSGLEKLMNYFSHVYVYPSLDHDIHFIPGLKQYIPGKEIVTNLRGDAISDTKSWSSLNPNQKPFVTCLFDGQLGNQMFEIATTLAYAWDNNMDACFPDLNRDSLGNQYNKEHIFFRLNTQNPPRQIQNVYQDTYCSGNEIPIKNDLLLKGFFQCWKYFHHHRDKLLEVFAPSESVKKKLHDKYSDLIANPNTVAVHVRTVRQIVHQGDHPFVGLTYFRKAFEMYPKDTVFVVFSDRMEFCKSRFPSEYNKNFVFIEGNDHIEDLFLMSMMKHQISSPSSFSWWAAYLNQNPNKIVIVPKYCMRPHSKFPKTDVFCENYFLPEWKILDNDIDEPYPIELESTQSKSLDDHLIPQSFFDREK